MTFLAPSHLLLLVPVAALAAGYLVLQRRRRHYAVRFTNLDLLSKVVPKRPGWRRHLAALGVGLGLVSMVVGLARPVRDEKVPRDEATIVLAVDVSASMEATDIAPSRIEAATAAATQFVDSLPDGFQVGLVAYDQSARVLATPTTDRAAVLTALDNLETGQGTATGEGIKTALSAIETSLGTSTTIGDVPATATDGGEPVATIVLLSDGATTQGGSATEAASEAADAGVPVTTIAYGTASGSVVIDGQTHPVPADPASMQQVAEISGGQFYEAASANQLDTVYESIQNRVGYRLEQREVLRFFIGLGVVFLILAVGASMLWTGRFL